MRVAMVCTGNTCRSPMAEAILRHILARRGVQGIEVLSAGIMAQEGEPASEGTYLVALEHGLDVSSHRARLLTADLARGVDLVLAMGRAHCQRAADVGAARAVLLGEYAGEAGSGAEVPDPFGGRLEHYRATWAHLERLLEASVDRLVGDAR